MLVYMMPTYGAVFGGGGVTLLSFKQNKLAVFMQVTDDSSVWEQKTCSPLLLGGRCQLNSFVVQPAVSHTVKQTLVLST